jgi:hypothetical protein
MGRLECVALIVDQNRKHVRMPVDVFAYVICLEAHLAVVTTVTTVLLTWLLALHMSQCINSGTLQSFH